MFRFTHRMAPGPGPVDAPGGSGPGLVVSCAGHRRLPLVIAQARVHPDGVEWRPVDGRTARPDGRGNAIATCPVHGDLAISALEIAQGAHRVRRRFRSVGLLVYPR